MLLLYALLIIVIVWAGVRLIELIPNVHARDLLGIAWSFAPEIGASIYGLVTRCGLFWPISGARCQGVGEIFEAALLAQFWWFPVAIGFLALSLHGQSRTVAR